MYLFFLVMFTGFIFILIATILLGMSAGTLLVITKIFPCLNKLMVHKGDYIKIYYACWRFWKRIVNFVEGEKA